MGHILISSRYNVPKFNLSLLSPHQQDILPHNLSSSSSTTTTPTTIATMKGLVRRCLIVGVLLGEEAGG